MIFKALQNLFISNEWQFSFYPVLRAISDQEIQPYLN